MIIEDMKKDVRKFINEHPFVFVGLVIYLTFLIIYILIYIIFFADHKSAMSLNEIGDFLAGVFSPLAFLFLYLGYKQQGEEMSRNTAALEAQQVELKNSVEAQNSLLRLHETEQQEKHLQVLPKFVIEEIKAIRKTESAQEYDEDKEEFFYYDEECIYISFCLHNIGEIAKNILVRSTDNHNYIRENAYIVDKNENLKIKTSFDGYSIDQFEKGATVNNSLILTYDNIYGKTYEKIITYNLSLYYDPEEAIYHINFNVKMIEDN